MFQFHSPALFQRNKSLSTGLLLSLFPSIRIPDTVSAPQQPIASEEVEGIDLREKIVIALLVGSILPTTQLKR